MLVRKNDIETIKNRVKEINYEIKEYDYDRNWLLELIKKCLPGLKTKAERLLVVSIVENVCSHCRETLKPCSCWDDS